MTTTLGPLPKARLRQLAARIGESIATPLVPADYLDLIDPLWNSAKLRGRIVEIRPETRDAVTVVITPTRTWKGHLPGQYVRIGVDVDGVRLWRTYSLTSETATKNIAITVKAIDGGKVSNFLVRRATAGTVVQLEQASGDFTLDEATPKALFVTAGSGVTPVMGMLRNHLDKLDDVVVVHTAPAKSDVIFGGELRMLARQGKIRLIERHTTTDGRLTPNTLAELVADYADRETWACGPGEFLDALEAHWESTGIASRLNTERFRTSIAATGDGGAVTFARSGKTVDSDGSQSLLEDGEGAGVIMPSGCRIGICHGCVVPLREGTVRGLRDGQVTTAAPGDGVLIQTCITAASGPCEIEL